MSAPRASVIIPNRNGVLVLPTCLNSLREQTCREFEIILVDDASSDHSLALVEEDYPEVKVVALPINRGFAGAANAGIVASRGEIVVLLNNDTEATPQWLQALLDALDDHPEAGMAASRMMLFDRRNVFHSAGDLYGHDGLPRNRGVWQTNRGQYDRPDFVFGPCGGAAAYRRHMLAEVGLFDERLFMYLEDVDIAWRAQLAGYRCIYAPDATVYHRLSATGGGPLASYYTGRNTIAILAKDVPTPILRRHWRSIVKAQLTITLDALRAWRGSASRARLRGQLAGLFLAVALSSARRRTQDTRRVSIEYLESLLV